MGSHVKQIPNDEAFWTSLVETNMRLGWEKCMVPLGNLNAEAAKILAGKLDVHLEITDGGYVFRKDEMWIRPKQTVDQGNAAKSI